MGAELINARQNRITVSQHNIVPHFRVAGRNTAEIAEFRISVDRIREALQRLTPDQRDVILLKFSEGLSNQEVAETLSKPVGAIKSLQHRALTNLRRLLVSSEERVNA